MRQPSLKDVFAYVLPGDWRRNNLCWLKLWIHFSPPQDLFFAKDPPLEVSMQNWLEVAISSKWELEAVLSHPLEVNGIGRHDTVLIILPPNNTTGNHQYDADVTKTRTVWSGVVKVLHWNIARQLQSTVQQTLGWTMVFLQKQPAPALLFSGRNPLQWIALHWTFLGGVECCGQLWGIYWTCALLSLLSKSVQV